MKTKIQRKFLDKNQEGIIPENKKHHIFYGEFLLVHDIFSKTVCIHDLS